MEDEFTDASNWTNIRHYGAEEVMAQYSSDPLPLRRLELTNKPYIDAGLSSTSTGPRSVHTPL
jgi:hypothetical protein